MSTKTAERSYLVAARSGISTGAGRFAAGDYVPESALGESKRRMLRTGAVLDVVEQPAAPKGKAKPKSGGKPSPVLDAAAAAGGPVPVEASDVAGVVAQPVPVVLRFLAAYPQHAGEVIAAEKRRDRPRSTVIAAARAAHSQKAKP